MTLCLSDVQRQVGAPPSPACETYHRQVGKLRVWAWRDASFGARDGWTIAISCSDIVLCSRWEMGGPSDRNQTILALLKPLLHLNADPQVSA